MKINIFNDSGSAMDTLLTLADGSPLQNVEAVNIQIVAKDLVRAELTFCLPHIKLKNCEVTVTEKHLRELAEKHGFDLVRK